eukprot:TRINITY_DN4417_c0_g1_i2.p1 TRINITY_DN4417_c0_g1~~TRINITY_DN4417_c0_g1_i2.p1  ORF type:complete len:266 (+),score=21.68 TRINITY_DN4417_c0_g1_i2:213-1010(+)
MGNQTKLCTHSLVVGCWQVILWVTTSFYWYLDTHPEFATRYAFRKLPVPTGHIEPRWTMQIQVALRNMIIALVVIFIVANYLDQPPLKRTKEMADTYYPLRMGRHPFIRSSDESLLRTGCWFFIYIFVSDIFFYFGHLLMHRWKDSFLHRAHALHHSSKALSAISGYYMTVLDFFMEHMPIFLAFFFFSECGPAWSVTICIGTFNLLTTHSGWDHPNLPDPIPHYLHHKLYYRNFGILFDEVFGTRSREEEESQFRLGVAKYSNE